MLSKFVRIMDICIYQCLISIKLIFTNFELSAKAAVAIRRKSCREQNFVLFHVFVEQALSATVRSQGNETMTPSFEIGSRNVNT